MNIKTGQRRYADVLRLCVFALLLSLTMMGHAHAAISNQTELESAIAAASGGTVKLNQNLTLNSDIAINNNVTIDGDGCKLEAASTRHFKVATGASLTLQNVVLDGAEQAGGIEMGASTLVLEDGAIIQNCKAVTGNQSGGGIYAPNTGSSVTLKKDAIVQKNHAGVFNPGGGGTNEYGGGIYARGELIIESGAKVTENTATSRGGGIYATGDVTISGEVSKNASYRVGGGMYYEQAGSKALTVNGATFSNNVAYGFAANGTGFGFSPSGGGAIFLAVDVNGQPIQMSNSYFKQNRAPKASELYSNGTLSTDYYTDPQCGGAISMENTKGNHEDVLLTLSNCVFEENEAASGGAVFTYCHTTMDACVFINNRAQNAIEPQNAYGGAIYMNAQDHSQDPRGWGTFTLKITGGAFTNNSAYYGGVFSCTNGNYNQIRVDGTQFSLNSAGFGTYRWEVTNPISNSRFPLEDTLKTDYLGNINNVRDGSQNTTNIYNCADVNIYPTWVHTSFDANGGQFTVDNVVAYLGEWYAMFSMQPPTVENILADDLLNVPSDLKSLYVYNRFNADLPNPIEGSTSPLIPVRSGYTFAGWQKRHTGAMLVANELTNMQSNYSLVAQWTPVGGTTYQVVYDANGGKGGKTVTGLASGAAHTIYSKSDADVTRSGYSLTGWNTKADGTGTAYAAGDKLTISADIILYAQWKPNGGGGGGTATEPSTYKVTYDPNGGSGGIAVSGLSTGTKHTIYTQSGASVKREGFALQGWNTKADGSGTAYAAGDTLEVRANVTLYAQWEAQEDILNKKDHLAYINGYPDGTVRPNNNITRAEVATIFYNLLNEKGMAQGGQFADVATDAWFANQVHYLASIGILSGYPDGNFRPNQPITRAEFAAISARFDALADTAGNAFPDVASAHWAIRYIQSAYAKGWVTGYPDGTFRPENNITRAEVVSIVNKMLERKIDDAALARVTNPYTDLAMSHWAYGDVIEASVQHTYTRDEHHVEVWDLTA